MEEYVDQPAVSYDNISESSDIEIVRAAVAEIESRGNKPSRRKVAAITGFGETKAGELMKQVIEQ